METLFLLCAGLLLYTFLLYPAALALLGLLAPRRLRKGEGTPPVALIIAACNEERHVGALLERVLAMDYPRERLEIVVASDAGSTDRTHAIVRAHARHGIRLCLPAPGLIGKNVSLDEAVRTTRGEILVFADATAIWRPEGLRALVAGFADPRIGCVAARKAYWLEDGFGPGSYRRYWRLEGLVDQGSSVLGYVPNASGGLHALRRPLYEEVPNHMIRDLVDPAQAAGRGRLAVMDPEVPYLDAPWVGLGEVHRARVRITMRALSSTPYILGRLLRGRRPLAAWQFVSHKLLRWTAWAPAAGLLASSLQLAPQASFFAAAAGLQALLYLAAAAGLLAAHRGRPLPFLSDLGFLVLSLLAMAQGCLLWLAGRRRATWRLRPA